MFQKFFGLRKGKTSVVGANNTRKNPGASSTFNQFKNPAVTKKIKPASVDPYYKRRYEFETQRPYVSANKIAKRKENYEYKLVNTSQNTIPSIVYTEENANRMKGIARKLENKSATNWLRKKREGYKWNLVTTSNKTPRTAYTAENASSMKALSNQITNSLTNQQLKEASKESGQPMFTRNQWLQEQRKHYKFPLVNTSNMAPRTSYSQENIETYKTLPNPLGNVIREKKAVQEKNLSTLPSIGGKGRKSSKTMRKKRNTRSL